MGRLLILLVFVFSSCGESPLLNHRNESSDPLGGIFPVNESVYRFRKTRFNFTLSWDESPRLGQNTFVLKTWSKERGTAQGPFEDVPGDLHIFLWMPAMGHGSAPVELKKISQGEIEVRNVVFIMGGAWQIKFQQKKNGKVIDEALVSYRL
jgi:hypothetical protein